MLSLDLRILKRWSIKYQTLDRMIGGKSLPYAAAEEILQYRNSADVWEDVRVVEDEESRKETLEKLKKLQWGRKL